MAKLTTYKKPSIAERIASAPDLFALAFLRLLVTMGMEVKAITAEDKTVERWGINLWSRVLDFIREAKTADELCLIRNATLRWERSEKVEALLEEAFQRRARQLASPTEALLAQGITIEGIT